MKTPNGKQLISIKITECFMQGREKIPWEMIRSFVDSDEEADKIAKSASIEIGIKVLYRGLEIHFEEK